MRQQRQEPLFAPMMIPDVHLSRLERHLNSAQLEVDLLLAAPAEQPIALSRLNELQQQLIYLQQQLTTVGGR